MSSDQHHAAEEQFHTSSNYPTPKGYLPWQINVNYPFPKHRIRPEDPFEFEIIEHEKGEGAEAEESMAALAKALAKPWVPGPLPGPELPSRYYAPWLQIDFRKHPEKYADIIKEYFFAGNTNNDFIVQDNPVRPWYHAPWMHASVDGREPLRGLTFERATPAQEFAITQNRILQNWACGFFNSAGASVLGGMWRNPDKPLWGANKKFPQGTLVCKVLFNDATNEELPNMVGSPTWKAVIAKTPQTPGDRNTEPSNVRLIQIDFAAADRRADTGWIFGTFVYDGFDVNVQHLSGESPEKAWERVIPVGIQWGNDPELTQAKFEAGGKAVERWINPVAEKLRLRLKGKRPSWGWNGRMNGPADNFISACASCHSTAQKPLPPPAKPVSLVPPKPDHTDGKWIPKDDKVTMNWFRNIPAGTPFTDNTVSADYSLQIMIGWERFETWKDNQPGSQKAPEERRKPRDFPLRSGPIMVYE